MNEFIQKVKSNFNVCEENLNKLKHLKNIDKSQIEQAISSNLDMYIEKRGEELMSLDIQTLYNIFSQSNGNFDKHNEAYELIKKQYEKQEDDSIFILLSFLESEKLTNSNIKEIINESENRFGFLPKKTMTIFEEQNKQIDELSKELDKEKEEKEDKNKQIDEISKELDKEKEEKEDKNKQIEELSKRYQQTQEELKRIKEENGEYKNIISTQKGEIDRLERENVKKEEKIKQNESNLNEKDKEIERKLEELKSKTSEYESLQTRYDEKVEEIRTQKSHLTRKEEEIMNMRNEIRDIKEEKASMQTTINNKTTEINRLENIINEKREEIRNLQTKVTNSQNEIERLNKYIKDETVPIYHKGDYSKIINVFGNTDMDEYKKNYAMEITRKSFNMYSGNYDRAKYVMEKLESRYGGDWCVFIKIQYHGSLCAHYCDKCYLQFDIGEYDVNIFKSSK